MSLAEVHGRRIRYEMHGRGAPVVLLHGGAATLESWSPRIEMLSHRYEVIAPEQAQAASAAGEVQPSIDLHLLAEEAFELLRQLNVERTLLLGWRYGGVESLDIAMNHPDLVGAMVVCSTPPAYTREQLARVQAPTLVVAGDRDAVRVEDTVALFESIPGAELWIAPNSDDLLPMRHADLFDDVVGAFLERQCMRGYSIPELTSAMPRLA